MKYQNKEVHDLSLMKTCLYPDVLNIIDKNVTLLENSDKKARRYDAYQLFHVSFRYFKKQLKQGYINDKARYDYYGRRIGQDLLDACWKENYVDKIRRYEDEEEFIHKYRGCVFDMHRYKRNIFNKVLTLEIDNIKVEMCIKDEKENKCPIQMKIIDRNSTFSYCMNDKIKPLWTLGYFEII